MKGLKTFFASRISVFILLIFISYSMTNSCILNVKLQQYLHNDGVHKNLTYIIKFYNQYEEENSYFNQCSIKLDQTLPPGVFVNPDELMDLRRINKVFASTKGHVNVELPTEMSDSLVFELYGKVSDSKADVWIPVHARYHRPAVGGGTARNEIPQAKFYLQCPDNRLNNCENKSQTSIKYTQWRHIDYFQLTSTPLWEVPVGNLDHYNLVAISTTLVVILGSIYVLKSILDFKLVSKKRTA